MFDRFGSHLFKIGLAVTAVFFFPLTLVGLVINKRIDWITGGNVALVAYLVFLGLFLLAMGFKFLGKLFDRDGAG